jgi:deazaflavin-dependent oxidoreductase (nitroreductase family)
MRDAAVKRWSRVHSLLYRVTGGRIGNRLVDNDILLLTTTGHVTGKPHTVPLLYLREGRRLVVIASYGGRPANPTWYQNLRADPGVEVQVNAETMEMRARIANEAERTRWWPTVEAAYDGYEVYQSRTSRQIPVVFLEPLQ